MSVSDDIGDFEDLQIRLTSFRHSQRSRLVPVIGSGPSNSVLPDVSGMIQIFRESVPPAGLSRFDATIAPIAGTPLGYQNAASLVKRLVGDPALARAVRVGVLSACKDVSPGERRAVADDEDECRRLVQEGDWEIPEAYLGLTEFYKTLEGNQAGPILTTNFDPLIEVAFRNAGLAYAPVPVPFDSVPTPEQLRDQPGVPIIHFHGYWTSKATLSTIPQLTKDRPALEGLLRILFRNSTVLVAGYSGWEDAFMRSLARRVTGEDLDLLDAEVLWANYSSSFDGLPGSRLVESLNGSPGFTLYVGIDAHRLFRLADDRISSVPSKVVPAPFGFTTPSVAHGTGDPTAFADGAQPKWSDAASGIWPRLGATEDLWKDLADKLNAGGGGGAIAIGPMGEGKSLAIRQLALRVQAEYPECHVLWREVGAPRMTEEWFGDLQSAHSQVLICSDDADLIAGEIVAARKSWARKQSGITFLLASQDRLWWREGASLTEMIAPTVFHGLTDADSLAIAQAWIDLGVLPDSMNTEAAPDADRLAAQLMASANRLLRGDRPTLFGSILDVRHGDRLSQRVADLVDKLDHVNIAKDGSVTLGQIFGGICLLQATLDEDGNARQGASRPIISAMAGLSSEYADGKILESLGREAAISFAGSQVYARHPSIAKEAVAHLRATNRMVPVARLLGQAGGRLLSIGGLDSSEFRQAYLLGRSLEEEAEAVAAAKGAVEGARHLLEPRVSLIRVLRAFDPVRAFEYASAAAPHIHGFQDFGPRVRSFLTEFAHSARLANQPQFGMGLVALALDDGSGFHLDRQRASYAVMSLIKCACDKEAQTGSALQPVLVLARAALERVRGMSAAADLAGDAGLRFPEIEEVRGLTNDQLIAKLRDRLAPDARVAKERSGVEVSFNGALRLADLARLFDDARN